MGYILYNVQIFKKILALNNTALTIMLKGLYLQGSHSKLYR